MGFYESFYVRRINGQGKVHYHLKNIDLNRIESWEWIDNEHSKIISHSGDSFISKITVNELTKLMMSNTDECGRLFIFNNN